MSEISSVSAQQKENKMGIMPVGRLLIQMSLPMMISMLVQALYNIVDSIFVAQISEKALTAVSLAFPIQTLIIAVSTGTGVGINALLSKRLGQKKKRGSQQICRKRYFPFHNKLHRFHHTRTNHTAHVLPVTDG